MRGMGFNGEVIDSLGRAFAEGHGSGKRFFSKDSVAYIDRGRIIVTPIPDDESCESLVTPLRRSATPGGGGTLWFEHADVDDIDEPASASDRRAARRKRKLSYPLKVRRWSEGDAFVPFGMGGRRKKVSDMLIDDKISLPDKRRQFVVVSGGDSLFGSSGGGSTSGTPWVPEPKKRVAYPDPAGRRSVGGPAPVHAAGGRDGLAGRDISGVGASL